MVHSVIGERCVVAVVYLVYFTTYKEAPAIHNPLKHEVHSIPFYIIVPMNI